ncbi:MAG: MFS transporter [candidate division NC10 bacterium]|nr:MFS transporter [candidate division NC10 bacterium]
MSGARKLWWVAILYFAEGFPFGIVNDAVPVYLRFNGVRLADIGLLNLVGLAWTLKFLWAPAVDLWGDRRHWVLACQIALTVGLGVLVVLEPGQLGWPLWIVLAALALASATQDIAIDAYTITLLDPEEMGPANGVRVTGYRIALIAAGGLFVAAAGFIGWPRTFALAAALMGLAAVGTLGIPQVPGDRPFPPQSRQRLRDALWTPLQPFFAVPGFCAVLLFILTYKLGDMALGPMVRPFWVDQQFSPVQIGAVPGTLGVVSTILGALLGGALTKRWGFVRALWILGIMQAASNLVYAAAALLPPSTMWMYAASAVESFCGGLGTAPFLAFLMSICDKVYAATQYALLSALFGLTRVLAGTVSGWAAEAFGYGAYFAMTFFLAWPALLLLPLVRKWSLARAAAMRRPAGAEP